MREMTLLVIFQQKNGSAERERERERERGQV